MVKKATFRGEAILKLTRTHEQQARMVFLGARADADSAGARVASLAAAMHAHEDEIRRAVRSGADAEAMGAYRLCSAGIGRALTIERRRLATTTETLRRRREELLSAMKSRKALVRLRDRLAERRGRSHDRAEARRRDDAHAAYSAAKGIT